MDRKNGPKARPMIEAMEDRVCLTGGVGNTFALVAGEVVTANQPSEVGFTLDPSSFVRPGGKIVLGVDVTAQTNSKVSAKVASVAPKALASQTNAHRAPRAVPTVRTAGSSAVLATLSSRGGNNYTVKIQGKDNTTGALVVGFYLAGDADGNGIVNKADERIVRGLQGVSVANSKYDFDADANRDGLINRVDLNYTRINRGAKTIISPVLTANLDPASDTGDADRITTKTDVKFTGVATPGAHITYKEIAGRAPEFSTVADAAGNYTINTTLTPGISTFRVTSIDAFGQTISGQISPVVVQPA
jgi:Bacterial Ig-like domain